MKAICDFISRWMGVLVLLMAVFSFLVPAPIGAIPTWVINPLLGLIMFGMGLTLSAKDFRVVFSRPKDVLIGCLAQFTVMPLMAWMLAWAFNLPKELALGVILVGCCPGGTASNVITFLAPFPVPSSACGITSAVPLPHDCIARGPKRDEQGVHYV